MSAAVSNKMTFKGSFSIIQEPPQDIGQTKFKAMEFGAEYSTESAMRFFHRNNVDRLYTLLSKAKKGMSNYLTDKATRHLSI